MIQLDEDHREILLVNSFKSWLHCICTVTFDLELGQAIELTYPENAPLTDREKANICYLSFPDSNSGFVGDTTFHFRMRRDASRCMLSSSDLAYNAKTPAAINVHPCYYFGFVYFRQMKDPSIARGYLQKSVVLISQLPLFNLFQNVLHFIAPGYFSSGRASVEAACHNIDQWPAPEPGEALSLPLMGSVLSCRIPYGHILDKSSPTGGSLGGRNAFPEPVHLPAPHELPLYDLFFSMLPYLHFFWELVLLNEPLMVMAFSPRSASEFVQCLASLVWPVQLAADYRPGVILGVTNPFFGKTLQHWPHIIRLGEDHQRLSDTNMDQTQENGMTGRLRKNPERTLDCKPGIYSKYSCFLQKDKAFLKRIFRGIQTRRPSEVQAAMIRKNFVDLTQSFLIPLERYLAGIMPLHRNISAFRCTPCLREFDGEEFLANMDEFGPQLTTGVKGDWIGLYRRFLETANFESWLSQRRQEINLKLEWLHLEAVCKADFSEAVADRTEVELVDLLFRLQEKERFLRRPGNVCRSPEFATGLATQKQVVLNALSPDLRASICRGS